MNKQLLIDFAVATVCYIAIIIGCYVVFTDDAEAAEYKGDHWATSFSWRVDKGCPVYVKTSVQEMLDKHAPVTNNYYGRSYTTPSFGDKQNVIYCGVTDVQSEQLTTPLPAYVDYEVTELVSREENAVAGRARRSWYASSLEMIECDVWLSTLFIDEENINKFTLHEVVGHCMGLTHSNDTNAVMYYAPSATQWAADDFAGITELYEQCHEKPYIDSIGNVYMPSLDVEDLLEAIDNRDHDKWRGVTLAAYLDANENWPAGLYNIKESACE